MLLSYPEFPISTLSLRKTLRQPPAEAEPLYQRAFRINEKALGPEHQSVAWILNNWALLRYAQRLPEQDSLFLRVPLTSSSACFSTTLLI